MNNLSIEQRNRIFKNVPEGYDWAAMDRNSLWYAYKKQPDMYLSSFMWYPQRYEIFIPLGYIDDIKIGWQDSLITRPTNEELNNNTNGKNNF